MKNFKVGDKVVYLGNEVAEKYQNVHEDYMKTALSKNKIYTVNNVDGKYITLAEDTHKFGWRQEAFAPAPTNCEEYMKLHNFKVGDEVVYRGGIEVFGKGCKLGFNDSVYYPENLELGKTYKVVYINSAASGINLKGWYYPASVFEKVTKEKQSRFPFQLSKENAEKIIDIACSIWKTVLAKKWGVAILTQGHVMIDEDYYKKMREACTTEQNALFDDIFGPDSMPRTLQDILDEFPEKIKKAVYDKDKTAQIVGQKDDKFYLKITTPSANSEWFIECMEYTTRLCNYLKKQPEVKYSVYPTIKDNELQIVVNMK